MTNFVQYSFATRVLRASTMLALIALTVLAIMDTPLASAQTFMFNRADFVTGTGPAVLAVGDFNFQDKCLSRLRSFREAGKTILFVSHSMDQIESYCDRAILLEKGKLAVDGTPAEAIKAYIGESSMEEPVLVETPAPRA